VGRCEIGARLMTEFYQHMLQDSVMPEAALGTAMRSMALREPSADPAPWAVGKSRRGCSTFLGASSALGATAWLAIGHPLCVADEQPVTPATHKGRTRASIATHVCVARERLSTAQIMTEMATSGHTTVMRRHWQWTRSACARSNSPLIWRDC
jgi:hypothetical protein